MTHPSQWVEGGFAACRGLGRTLLTAATLLLPGLASAGPLPKPGGFLLQLQEAQPEAVAQAGFPLVVMDYSRDGGDPGRYRPAEIALLVQAGVMPLAYLSIGEAEDYRAYWQPSWSQPRSAPPWLGQTNPDWGGNHKVRYWDPSWRDEVLGPYLDTIVGQGFKGVYLDIIDAFEYWADPANYGKKKGQEEFRKGDPRGDEGLAARHMIDLVLWIAQRARRQAPGFLVVPQNGERILDHDRDRRYLDTVSGIGVEDTWYDATEPQPEAVVAARLPHLRRILAAGADRFVLALDYVDNGDHGDPGNLRRIRHFIQLCRQERFHCYAAHAERALDRINVIPGLQPPP
ncbi:MAG: endo alpha-1,4 polygalactosaminidase [Magnetococcales bacterium]|nr:endo alpha-1,4 polygalactosaminidase [Magnetococcales bacterium]